MLVETITRTFGPGMAMMPIEISMNATNSIYLEARIFIVHVLKQLARIKQVTKNSDAAYKKHCQVNKHEDQFHITPGAPGARESH